MRLTRLFPVFLIFAAAIQAHSLKGLWDGTVNYDDYKIPFLIQFSQKGDTVSAAFFNGDEQVTSTGGRLNSGVAERELRSLCHTPHRDL